MFKKSFMYLILIMSLFFGFNSDVFAAKIPELTCKYYNDSVNYMITQNSDGTGKVYKNAKGGEVSTGGTGWTKVAGLSNLKWGDSYGKTNKNGVIVNWGTKLSDSNPNYLKSCPKGFTYYKKGYFIFEKKDSDGFELLKKKVIPFKSKENKYIEPEVVSHSIRGESGSYIGKSCPTEESSNKWITTKGSLATCLYAHKAQYDDGCHVVQINIAKSGKIEPFHDYPVKASESTYHSLGIVSDNVNLDKLIEEFDGYCPDTIMVYSAPVKSSKVDIVGYTHEVDFLSEKARGVTYTQIGVAGKNVKDTSKEQEAHFEGFNVGFLDTRDQIESCSEIIGEDGELVDLLHMIVNLVKIIIPIMVIVLGSLDFVSAIFANDENNMKKAQTKFIKRLIIAIVIFLVPSLLRFILEIANNIWPNLVDSDLCGIL